MQSLTLTEDREFEKELKIVSKKIRILDAPISKFRNETQKAESLVVIKGGDEKINRLAVENKKIDILLSPEDNNKKDSLFFRNSGLNHVLCRLANKNNVAIGFDFSFLLNSEKEERSKILGRMIQNARLCKKFRVKMVFSAFARNKYELRSKAIIDSFRKVVCH